MCEAWKSRYPDYEADKITLQSRYARVDTRYRTAEEFRAAVMAGKQITIARNLVGNYITSLDMAGCSLTLLRLDDELIKYWDAPVYTPALRWGV